VFLQLLGGAERDSGAVPLAAAPARGGEVSIECRGVSRRFGAFTAVDAIDLSVRRGEIFLAKVIPTIALVLTLSTLSFLLVLVPVFGLPVRGSLLLFFGVTALYVFAMTSIGIAIALVARNMAQAVLIMILILQPMIFLSGAWNPPEARLRGISLVSPLRYYIDFAFGVILKGNGVPVVLGHRGHRRARRRVVRFLPPVVRTQSPECWRVSVVTGAKA
jgi:hypothetical protein